jgi:hypothetical protein
MKGTLFRSCLFVRFVANFFSKSKTADLIPAILLLTTGNHKCFMKNPGTSSGV